jgi:molybdopterin molybdotransferase
MVERVLGFAEALAEVLRHAGSAAAPRSPELVALSEVEGRVLAAAVRAGRDQPPFDRSTRDGYAVRSADVGRTLRVVGSVKAGEVWHGAAVGRDEAIEIMTGAPLPKGADAVAMVEHVVVADGLLRVQEGRTLRAGENVAPRGAEARAGDSLLPVGCVLGAAEIAVAASCGCAELTVFARLKVAIVATGDELVELTRPSDPTLSDKAGKDGPPGPTHGDDKTVFMDGAPGVLGYAQIYNSNSYALAALVRAEGGFAGRLKIARDTRQDVWDRIAQGSMWDLLVLSGGVSMGKFDLVEEVLAEFDAEFFFTGALIQPGKPVVFGRLPKRGGTAHPLDGPWTGEWTYFFGLPGNPVSTQVCFHLFVAPLLRALAGRSSVAPEFVEARLAEDVRRGAKVTRFLPAEMVSAWDGVTVRVVGWQGSGDVAANARGNCYCVLPAGVEAFAKGETVRVLLR